MSAARAVLCPVEPGSDIASIHIHLYQGRAQAACELLDRRWFDLHRSFAMEVQIFRVALLELRARCALACAGAEGIQADRRRALLQAVERGAARIGSEGMNFGSAVAKLLQAGVA